MHVLTWTYMHGRYTMQTLNLYYHDLKKMQNDMIVAIVLINKYMKGKINCM